MLEEHHQIRQIVLEHLHQHQFYLKLKKKAQKLPTLPVEEVMGEVELVANKHASGSTVNKGGEDLWGVAELGIDNE
ncbi:hypothetical protein C0993_005886 [Termitomyces sp. T159_Od127]|nr:hypothetical protein C0993_005886 [Termitomyces sp. T159_Od127]